MMPASVAISALAVPTAPAGEVPEVAGELIGDFLPTGALLGRRTAELHLALARGGGDPAFRPEPYTPLHQRALYQSMRGLTIAVFESLRLRAPDLPEWQDAVARMRAELYYTWGDSDLF